jgi:rod shape-determining protein MreC
MRNIFAFILRYHFILLFLILEIISFTLFVNSTYYQRSAVLGFGNRMSGKIYSNFSEFTGYLKLRKTNEVLATENAMLHHFSEESYIKNDTSSFWKKDTLYKQQFMYIVAKVIDNSVGKRNNYIMLNKGRLQGIDEDMAVITSKGIVGTVVSVSDNFAWVMSVLHRQTKISCKIKSNNQMGTVIWKGVDHNIGTLIDIPAHVKIKRGDTIVTSGYSNIFPAGIMAGTIIDYRVEQGEHFYIIPFKFSVDFNSLDYVYVVKNLMKEEQDSLIKSTEDLNNVRSGD